MKQAICLLTLIFLCKTGVSAASEYQQVKVQLAETMQEMYLFPEVGKQYAAAMLNNPELEKIDSDKEFAERATEVLQAIHKDGHLAVIAKTAAPAVTRKRRTPPPALEIAEMLTQDIAYLKLLHMPGDDKTLSGLTDFLDKIRGSKALIIDVRKNFGGGLLEIDRIFSELYTQKTPLLYMDLRVKAEEQGYSSLEQTPQLTIDENPPQGIVRRIHSALPSQSPGLNDTRVFVLTSNQTPSAAEHLTLALKRTKRAEIIGETTAGLGHFGETIRLDPRFVVFVPIGATINPDTGKGWEGDGVQPSINIPASDALRKALELTGLSSEEIEKISLRYH